MSQEVRTVNDLISSAFYLIGEFSENETIEGVDFQRGLDILNQTIDGFSVGANLIPFTQEIIFNLVPLQRDYVVSNVPGVTADIVANRIVEISNCQLVWDNFTWEVVPITRNQIFDNSYSLTVNNIPVWVLLKKYPEKSVLSFYALPDKAYEIRLNGKFYLDKFVKNQPIRNVPLYVQEFLIYQLGRKLTAYYPSSNWADRTEVEYQKMYKNLTSGNDIDISVKPSRLLADRNYLYSGFYGLMGGI